MASNSDDDIRVVIGLDFGTTYSGFTYCHVFDKDMCTNNLWPGEMGQLKTNTVLQYDDDLDEVVSWGYPALYKRPSRKKEKNKRKNIVELFKLHLGDLRPELRVNIFVDYKKAITDYLREIGECIKETVKSRWNDIDFHKNVRLVLTVPAEYSERAKLTMRECASDAGLIGDKHPEMLRFTTEPEAAAISCMDSNLKEHDLTDKGTTFMIVDCGGGTVDLTTRKLLRKNKLGEVTERMGDYCGSTFIDREFKSYLQRKLGNSEMKLFEENHYGQLQYMVQEFCENAKLPFTGDNTEFGYEMDLEEVRPALQQYLKDEAKDELEENEWLIKFDYDTIKSMFDPIVERIINMIQVQLDNSREKGSVVSIMFLVGGFSESKYLQNRIKQKFQDQVDDISVPPSPTAAISRGATIYGLSLRNADNKKDTNIIGSRVLKYTYGVEAVRPWSPGDPWEKMIPIHGIASILSFNRIAKRGTVAKIEDKFPPEGFEASPVHPFQTSGVFEVYYTRDDDGNFCDDDGMKLLGKLKVDWSEMFGSGYEIFVDKSFTFKLAFGKMEITATAVNNLTGRSYQTSFEVNEEN